MEKKIWSLILLLLISNAVHGQRDTSYTNHSAWTQDRKKWPELELASPQFSNQIQYLNQQKYKQVGNRQLLFDYVGPVHKQNAPALAFFHGGGWKSGSPAQHIALATRLAHKGYRVFLFEYRLSAEERYPAAMVDAHAAVIFLFTHAKKWRIDPNQISVGGFSAGAQMASLLSSSWNEGIFGSPKGKIHKVINIDGILDFLHPESGEGDDRKQLSAATQYFGVSKEQNPSLWRSASALHYVSKQDPPALFINSNVQRMHAGREDFRHLMYKEGISTQVLTLPNAPHSFLLYDAWILQVVEVMDQFLSKKHQTHVVAQGTSIQRVINLAAPGDRIRIANGLFEEKLFFDSTKTDLFIQGSGHTIIQFPQARDAWRCRNPDDYGAAVLNIKGKNIHFDQLIVRNSYSEIAEKDTLIPCTLPESNAQGYALPREKGEPINQKWIRTNGHQFAVRAFPGATPLTFTRCHFFSGPGGDTMSPWDAQAGQYAFKRCSFEGGVDLYCPRGSAWAEDCKFYSHSKSAAIWHDGSGDSTFRSVLVRCHFDGIQGFPLGRYHREASMYLVSCTFSDQMAQKPIYQASPVQLIWGHRIHYLNCPTIPSDWGQPTQVQAEEITPTWTFQNTWNPDWQGVFPTSH